MGLNDQTIFQSALLSLRAVRKNINMTQARSKNQNVVYSACFGGYDGSVPPILKSKFDSNVDYFLISDRIYGSLPDNINLIILDVHEYVNIIDNNRVAKFFKLFPHIIFKNYKKSLWIDSNIVLMEEHSKIFSLIEDCRPFFVFKHDKRSNIKSEVEECIKWRRDDPITLQCQYQYYLDDNFEDNNLFLCRYLLRAHNELVVKKMMREWWRNILKFSRRDQISLPYIAWKLDHAPNFLPVSAEQYFQWRSRDKFWRQVQNRVLQFWFLFKKIV